MPFSKEDRILIKELRLQKGCSARWFKREFPAKNWSLSGLNRLLRQLATTDSTEARQGFGGGKPRSSRTPANIEAVEELIMSQEDQPSTHRTIRQIARETGLSKTAVHKVIHEDLRLKCLKKMSAQQLTDASKLTRLVRCKQLLRQYPQHKVNFIWFTDEKLFTVAEPMNSQNDRLYVTSGTRKKNVPANRLLKTRPTFSKSIMVSIAVSSLGCTELIFVEPGVKINGAYYRDVLLTKQMLPAIRKMSGDYYIFQQDSAPAHRAKDTVAMLKRETPEFISPLLWPPNSPDLNPVDYKIWGILQDRVYRTRIRDIDHLKQRLIAEWSRFDQGIIDCAVIQWRQRLSACVRAAGGHFEYQL